jgi:hypothetical protein
VDTELFDQPVTARLGQLLAQVEHALSASPVAHRDEGWGSRAASCDEAFAALFVAQSVLADYAHLPLPAHLEEADDPVPPRCLPGLLRELEAGLCEVPEHLAPTGWPETGTRVRAAVVAVQAVLRAG